MYTQFWSSINVSWQTDKTLLQILDMPACPSSQTV